ncbi:hypothetical protein BaRGS_00029487 [Batillaria attramentaria]|uniref:SOCS box domain-containing protein n=1 Tax=Batillaria attramentaria TaxID=370345 RepID=A0ABD0JVX9_9CAEN
MEDLAHRDSSDAPAGDGSGTASVDISQPDECATNASAINAIVLNIQAGRSARETSELFEDTPQFLKGIRNWRDPDCSLNLLQFAVIHRCCDFVKLFYTRYRPLFFEAYSHVQVGEETGLLLNFPVHLACWVGHLPILQFISTCHFGGLEAAMEAVSVINLHRTSVYPLRFKTKDVRESPRGKPFEFAVANDHLPCVQFLLDSVILQSNALRFLYGAVREPSQLLHRACSVGCGELVELVLKRSFKDVVCLNDKNGKTPLHTAVWNGDTKTIGLLLSSGADVNACTESRQNCLHILYRSKVHACNYVKNTELLLEHGIDCNAVDKNGKAALHVLAEEIAMTDAIVLRLWTQAAEAISSMTSSKDVRQGYTIEVYQRDLLECLRLLLEHGADPSLQTYHDCHNIHCFSCQHYRNALEVLMYKVTDKCLKNAQFFYGAVSLLLCASEQHAQDGNQEFLMAALAHFVSNSMHKMDDTGIQAKLIHLFCQHACVTDITIPLSRVMQSLVHHSLDLSCVRLVANYMPLGQLQELREGLMKKRIHHLLQSSDTDVVDYGAGLMAVFEEAPSRSLRHICKLCILKHLCHRRALIEQLPLPAFLKTYLSSDAF